MFIRVLMNQTILIRDIKFTKLAIKLIILGENYDILLHVGKVYTVWSEPCHHLQQSRCVALTPFGYFFICFYTYEIFQVLKDNYYRPRYNIYNIS